MKVLSVKFPVVSSRRLPRWLAAMCSLKTKNLKLKTPRSGFTLIETFVAITILIMAIVGPLTIASQSALLSVFSRSQIMANFLAQDAIEYVRWMRDTNQLSGRGWRTGLDACLSATCAVDTLDTDPWTNHSVQSCSGDTCVVHFDPTSGFYDYNTSKGLSPFTRTVSITYPFGSNNCSGTNDCEAFVQTVVTWQTGTLTHSVTLSEHLMSWAGS